MKLRIILLGFLMGIMAVTAVEYLQYSKQVGAAPAPSLNTFVAGTTILSSEVNSNFSALRTAVNEVNSAQILDATLTAADHASGFLVNSLVNANADINASKILLSGAVQLDEWTHASDATKIDGADLYAASVPVSALASDAKTFDSYDSGWFAVTNYADYTKAHGLSGVPEIVVLYLSITNVNTGWTVIAETQLDGGVHQAAIVFIDDTNIKIRTDEHLISFRNLGGNATGAIDSGYMKIVAMKFN